jgi:elongation factor P--(R)-beta-lysine ligase
VVGAVALTTSWRPSATLARLRLRAATLRKIRAFFAARDILEVDTPALAHAGSTDPALASLCVQDADGEQRYLQTSPEFAMKRLLAAGSGDIYQLCHAFRREEHSRLHLEEFTLLEWYRTGFNHHQLMDELVALLVFVGLDLPVERMTYAELSRRYCGIDPHRATTAALADYARANGAQLRPDNYTDRALLLDLLFALGAIPRLPSKGAVLVYDFPVEHAAYARISTATPPVAERFELIVDRIELANGFHEVTDPNEQRRRQVRENARRLSYHLPQVPIDETLIAALASGLPPCAGVALGIDRLLMVLADATHINEVVAFGEASSS